MELKSRKGEQRMKKSQTSLKQIRAQEESERQIERAVESVDALL